MDDPAPPLPSAPTRRALLAAGLAAAVAGCGSEPSSPARAEAARRALASGPTIDMHSHAGRVNRRDGPFSPVAESMRTGGMAAICLAFAADLPVIRLSADGRIAAFREPAPGELRGWGRAGFARIHALAREQQLAIVTDRASLAAAGHDGPAVIVTSEGADWLEGALDPLAEAYAESRLRHLQLTHYRVNALGDIQSESPVHDGLSDFGADVIRACNRMGVVVDVAHGTYELVKRAAAVTAKPLILSHTSLSLRPAPRSRLISFDHARAVADTGGVIGIWPPITVFADMTAFATGFAKMAEVVGVEHVGLGSDMLGLPTAASFDDYATLPALAGQLLTTGFAPDEVAKLLGGNYVRVFNATVA